MKEILSKEELDVFLNDRGSSVLYIGAESCSVCRDLYPKVETLMESYPKLKLFKIEYSKFPELGGMLSIHTVPAIIGRIDGKEFLREARFISIDELRRKIDRYYGFLE